MLLAEYITNADNQKKIYDATGEGPANKADLEAAGLKSLSSHIGHNLSPEELASGNFEESMKWWDQAIAAHKAAGMTYLVTPSGPVPKNLKEAQTLCDYYNAIGERCRQAGLSYGYHTHSHEYQKVEGTPWIEIMLKNVKPENMFWQMDVYWCVMAQQSPVVWFKKFPGRCRMLHIKDLYELGQSGMLGFDAIFQNAGLCGLENYIVELEGTDGTIDSMEGVRQSAAYLISKPWVKASYSK